MNFIKQIPKKYIFLLFFSALIACSQVNQANFDKIKTGMTMQQVTQILGQPSDIESVDFAGISGTSATWKTKDTNIIVQFISNAVKIKILNKISSENNHPATLPEN